MKRRLQAYDMSLESYLKVSSSSAASPVLRCIDTRLLLSVKTKEAMVNLLDGVAEDEPVVIPQLKSLPPVNPLPVVTMKAEPVFVSRMAPEEVIDLGDDVVSFSGAVPLSTEYDSDLATALHQSLVDV
ncbi:hypothetical protein A2U01_0022954, partial [Trifolium medium]|nr:hypothetical protein [Trifolium medium]